MMPDLPDWLYLPSDGTWTEGIGWLLVHSLWQFLLLAFVAWSIIRWVHRDAAAVRYRLLSATLFLALLAPMATWIVLSAPHQGMSHSSLWRHNSRPNDGMMAPPEEALDPIEGVIASSDGGNFRPIDGRGSAKASLVLGANEGSTYLADRYPFDSVVRSLRPWLPCGVFLWLIGVLFFSVRPIISWWAIRRLHRVGGTLPSDSVQAALQTLKKKMDIGRNVRVLQSSIISSPVVVGIFQSVIFLPVSLSTSLPIAQIEAILAHELAHVKRFDFAVNLAQTIVETLFFYHPAIWWISKQIRVERENCCDDSVVSLLGNRCEYGRALLAIQERVGFMSTLALGAKDGSLLARIQRLSNRLDQQRSTPYGNMTATLLFAGLMVASTLGLVSVLLAQGDRKLIPFGAESNGLRFRLIPLAPDVDDDSPDLQRVVHSFRRSSDVTFAVELKNVGSKPIVLAGVRYGDGYAEESRGKRNASMFAPHWFEFEIMDKEGKPITRPQRSYHGSWSVVSGASSHVLQPGEAMVEVLRPSKFHAPMSWDFLPGEYQVRCRYHGPSDAMKEQIAKHWPSKEITKSWTHEVASNLLELSVGDQDRPLAPSQLVWGEPVEGLKAAVEFRSPKEVKENAHVAPGVPARTPIQVLFHVRNVSDRPISFVSETSRQGDSVKVLDESGKPVAIEDVFYTGWPIDVAWKLQPGETATLSLLSPSLGSLKQPGKYKVTYTIRFNSRQQKDETGKIIFPRPGDYDKSLETGEATLFLAPMPNETSLLPSPGDSGIERKPRDSDPPTSPYRLRDHWIVLDVRCVNNDRELVTLSVQAGVNVRRWDLATGQLMSEVKLSADKHQREYRQETLRLSRNGTRVLGATSDYVGIWDASTGELVRRLPFPKKQWDYDCVRCLGCSDDLSIVVAGLGTIYERMTQSYDGHGIVWNGHTGEVLHQVTRKNGFYFEAIDVSADGRYFATINERGGDVCLWETPNGNVLHSLSSSLRQWESSDRELIQVNMMQAIAFSPDAKRVAVSGTFGVRLFDTETGALQRTIDAPYRFSSGKGVRFSADGSKIARVGVRGTTEKNAVLVWSSASGALSDELLSDANAIAFSSDGSMAALAHSDFYEAVSVWPLQQKGGQQSIAAPKPYERAHRVEENTHYRGPKAKEYAERWQPIWGEPQQGFQYGIAFAEASRSYTKGEQVKMVAFLRNASKETWKFAWQPDMLGNVPEVVDRNGKTVSIGFRPLLGNAPEYRDTLEPGEVFGPVYLNLGLGADPSQGAQVWEPSWPSPSLGQYTLQHFIWLKRASPEASDNKADASWTGSTLVSGKLNLDIADDLGAALRRMHDCIRDQQPIQPDDLALVCRQTGWLTDSHRPFSPRSLQPRGIRSISLAAPEAWYRQPGQSTCRIRFDPPVLVEDVNEILKSFVGMEDVLLQILDGLRNDPLGPKLDWKSFFTDVVDSEAIVVWNGTKRLTSFQKMMLLLPVKDHPAADSKLKDMWSREPKRQIEHVGRLFSTMASYRTEWP